MARRSWAGRDFCLGPIHCWATGFATPKRTPLSIYPDIEIARHMLPLLPSAVQVPTSFMRGLWWRDNRVAIMVLLALGVGGLLLFAVY